MLRVLLDGSLASSASPLATDLNCFTIGYGFLNLNVNFVLIKSLEKFHIYSFTLSALEEKTSFCYEIA